jgi:hypothetical protein
MEIEKLFCLVEMASRRDADAAANHRQENIG